MLYGLLGQINQLLLVLLAFDASNIIVMLRNELALVNIVFKTAFLLERSNVLLWSSELKIL